MIDFGKAFLKAVAHKKTNRSEMASKLDLSKNYFYDLCAGKKRPSLDVIERTSLACGVKLSDFIRWGEE